MNTVEFRTKINNGKIEVPSQYHNSFDSDVKVIIRKLDYDDSSVKDEISKTAKGFGALAHRANPNLWDKEENAWEREVVKNYAID